MLWGRCPSDPRIFYRGDGAGRGGGGNGGGLGGTDGGDAGMMRRGDAKDENYFKR